MPYNYVAYTTDKNVVTGTIDVVTESLAEDVLENSGYQILSLEEVKPKQSLETLFPSVFGVKKQDVTDFSQQLAIMIGSGISLPSALRLLEGQAPSVTFREIISGLHEELSDGKSFSQALTRYPKVFPDIFCRIVKAGELSGNLDSALVQAVAYLERGSSAVQKVRNAMIYPTFILVLAIVVVTLLITVAMPPLMSLFNDLGAKLPWTTQLLISTSSFFIDYKFHMLGTAIVLISTAFFYFRRPSGRMVMDSLLMKLPSIGTLIIQSNMALFSRTASVLLGAGLSLPQIMDAAQQITGNSIIRQSLRNVNEQLIDGQGLARPMAMNNVFPPLMVQMVMVGEHSGTLDSNFARLADYYEEAVDKQIKSLIALLEPCITVVMGLGVGFIAISLITPMYSMMGSLE